MRTSGPWCVEPCPRRRPAARSTASRTGDGSACRSGRPRPTGSRPGRPASRWAAGALPAHLDDRDAAGQRVLATATGETVESLRGRGLRSELLDRLAASVILVPPLRDRRDEIPEIARRALHEVSPTLLPMGERIQPEALEALQRYAWPGNVRQLQNVLRRALEARP